MEFTAELEATGGTTTGFVVSDEVVEALGAGRRPKVVVTVQHHTYRTSIASMGGRFLLGASASVREAGAAWSGLTYSQQRQHAEAVLAAKKPETRERRVASIVAGLG